MRMSGRDLTEFPHPWVPSAGGDLTEFPHPWVPSAGGDLIEFPHPWVPTAGGEVGRETETHASVKYAAGVVAN